MFKSRKFLVAAGLFALLLTSNSYASGVIIKLDHFMCSNGKTYSVIRHYVGEGGVGSWDVRAFCNHGTLSKDSYESSEKHPDINRCKSETSPAITKCHREFVGLNGSHGSSDGRLPAIIHAKVENRSGTTSPASNPSFPNKATTNDDVQP